MHILLIDDDPDVRILAGFVLGKAGHVVTVAESGAEGVALAGATAFDLVLLDFRLGDTTGDRVLPTLLSAAPDRPVVFLTGNDEPDAVRALTEAGAAGVVAKPFDPEKLAERVAEIHSVWRAGR